MTMRKNDASTSGTHKRQDFAGCQDILKHKLLKCCVQVEDTNLYESYFGKFSFRK